MTSKLLRLRAHVIQICSLFVYVIRNKTLNSQHISQNNPFFLLSEKSFAPAHGAKTTAFNVHTLDRNPNGSDHDSSGRDHDSNGRDHDSNGRDHDANGSDHDANGRDHDSNGRGRSGNGADRVKRTKQGRERRFFEYIFKEKGYEIVHSEKLRAV
jgi:hypothetical protein